MWYPLRSDPMIKLTRRQVILPLFAFQLGLAALFFVAAPTPSWSQVTTGVADEAEVLFRLGNEAYRAGQFREALAYYFASNRLSPNRNVLFNAARCYEQSGQYVEAFRYYNAYLSSELSDDDKAAVDNALARVRPYVALVHIDTDPAGARLYIDRKDLGSYGQTPLTLALSPGQYTLLLESEGYHDFITENVQVKIGQTTNVNAKLSPILGTLKLQSNPPGAAVHFGTPDEKLVGVTPLVLELRPGSHDIRLRADGYVTKTVSVVMEPQKMTEVTATLERETGSLVVQADERDALILLDGKPVGFTPAVIDGIPTGTHALTIELEGFRSVTQQVDVVSNEKALVESNLVIVEDVAAASRQVESVSDAPASVTLVGKREIQAFGYRHSADALGGVRGMYLSDDLTYVAPGIRGFSPFGQYGNRMLVQIDGHTLNDNWVGSSYIEYDQMIDIDTLDRIEVVRGPGSALYGTGAFFGVLNLVTPEQAPPYYVRGLVSAATDNAFRATVDGGTPLGDDAYMWLMAGGLTAQGTDIYLPSFAGTAESTDGFARNVGGFDAGSVLARFGWKDFTIVGYFHRRDKQIPTAAFGTIFGDPDTASNDQRAFVEVRFEPELSESVHFLGRLYFDHYLYEGVFPYDDPETGTALEDFTGNWAGADVRVVWRPFDGGRFTIGGEAQFHFTNEATGKYAVNDEIYLDESHPFQQFAAYLIADYSPISWLGMSVGARFDAWQISDLPQSDGSSEDRFLFSVNPRAAFLFHPTDVDTLKLMGGRAFRAPSVYELTYWDGGITQIPSPNLEPEVIYTGELEYTHRFDAGISITGAVFFNAIVDLIEQVGSGEETDPLAYQNIEDNVLTGGAEIELRREFRRGWMFSVQYSFQRTRVKNWLDGDKIPNSPEHLAAIKAVVPLSGPQARLASRFAVESERRDRNGDTTELPLLWDLSLTGDIPQFRLSYAIGLRNLLDWRVEHPVGEDISEAVVKQRGRTLFADLRWSY